MARRTRQGFTETKRVQAILARYGTAPKGSGLGYFDGLPAAEARKLLAALPAWQAEDRQNDSPSFAEMVKLGQRYPNVLFHGYIVGPEREDERITIEGFYVPYSDLTPESMVEFQQMGPDEADIVERHGQKVYRTWWD